MSDVNITIIGGGVVGLAIANELVDLDDVVLIDKNDIPSDNQSSRNSGVIHSGIYYAPGSLKAKLCVEGNNLLYDFCEKNGVNYRKTGKLIVATNLREIEFLYGLEEIAEKNGVEGVEFVDGSDLFNYESSIKGEAALVVPSSGIIDPISYISKLREVSSASILTNSEVVDIHKKGEGYRIDLSSGDSFTTNFIINSAGLYSDEISKMIDPQSNHLITPLKSESVKFYSTPANQISTNIYPVPCAVSRNGEKLELNWENYTSIIDRGQAFQSVGVHLTPTLDLEGMIDRTQTVGPAYSKHRLKSDYSSSIDKEYFLESVKPFFPQLTLEDLSFHQTGIQSRVEGVNDFIIEKRGASINLIGIDSPGLTASLAIAKYVKNLLMN